MGKRARRVFASRSYSDNTSRKSRVYFRSCVLPGASTCSSGSVCDLYFVRCFDNKCFRRPGESAKSLLFSYKKKKGRTPYSSSKLFRLGRRCIRFYEYSRKVLCQYSELSRFSVTFLPLSFRIGQERKFISLKCSF